MSKKPKYTIIIPAYNEEKFIGSTLDKLREFLKSNGTLHQAEIIVVTADSPDKTAEIVKSKAKLFRTFKFIEPGRRIGKGRDVREGIMAAKGQYILFTDADLATPLRHITSAWQQLKSGSDMVIGERDIKKINRQFHRGFGAFISIAGNRLARLLVGSGIADTQCGLKAFNRKAAKLIFPKLTITGWSFDMEAIVIAKQSGLKISHIPIGDWRENKPYELQLAGDNRLISAFQSFMDLLRIKLNLLRGRYRPH